LSRARCSVRPSGTFVGHGWVARARSPWKSGRCFHKNGPGHAFITPHRWPRINSHLSALTGNCVPYVSEMLRSGGTIPGSTNPPDFSRRSGGAWPAVSIRVQISAVNTLVQCRAQHAPWFSAQSPPNFSSSRPRRGRLGGRRPMAVQTGCRGAWKAVTGGNCFNAARGGASRRPRRGRRSIILRRRTFNRLDRVAHSPVVPTEVGPHPPISRWTNGAEPRVQARWVRFAVRGHSGDGRALLERPRMRPAKKGDAAPRRLSAPKPAGSSTHVPH